MTAPETRERTEPRLRTVEIQVCELCLAGTGAVCYVPGCWFWMQDVPDALTASVLCLTVRPVGAP